ncbi:odorant receptor Or2-like [Schistocerca piceifrons]|uniref:odorant receptor Or2-like n=1 Tax=Schistocerca piceifrons TaxID=274613 RepID=UPI001F5F6F91|nr:odorant receptor Or2-like [Schistocerca piceifrons]
MVSVPTVMWTLDPVIVDGGEASSGRSLPLPIWLPGLDTSASPLYELVYVLQVCTLVVAVEASLYLDVFFVVLMLAIAGELHALNDAVAAIRSPAGRPGHAVPARAVTGTVDVATGAAPSAYKAMVGVVSRHQLILASIRELELVMNHSIFLLLFLNMLNICVHTFVTAVLLQKEVQPTTMYKMVSTLPIYMYETGLYCIFGQTIIDQGERLATSAFSSGWPECGVRFRRVLLVFMLRACQPLQLTVGQMYTLSRHTFLQLTNNGDTYGDLQLYDDDQLFTSFYMY